MEQDYSPRAIKQFADQILKGVGEKMYGVEQVTKLCLVALFSDGHVLLEGNPGLGKTALVKRLGMVLGVSSGRIQFTPDLMPLDITGSMMPNLDRPQGALEFQQGPIFTSLLLADEINRATPKTQSAMLEAMGESQVTVFGTTHSLPTPFMVLATQNPIDHEGTYELPEAQADRFMFKIDMPTPDGGTLADILRKETSLNGETRPEDMQLLTSGDAKARHNSIHHAIRKMRTMDELDLHVRYLFLASNGRFEELESKEGKKHFDRHQIVRAKELASQLRYGLGPRAAIAMVLGAKAWTALFAERPTIADGTALGEVVIPALYHRLRPKYGWAQQLYGSEVDTSPHVIRRLVADFCLATAPKGPYREMVESGLGDYQS